MEKQTHRYYIEKYPKEGEVVIGKIKSLAEMGAYVELPEYNNMEGLVIYSELTRKRTRNVQKSVKVGGLEAFTALRVDEGRGYIDLSKKRTQQDEKLAAFDRYTKGKISHNILLSVAAKTGVGLGDIYEMFGWPAERAFGSIYRCFKEASNRKEALCESIPASGVVTEEFLESVMVVVRNKFVVPKMKVRADVDLRCNRGDGVVVIRDVLVEVLETFRDVDIALISSPVFSLSILSEDKDVSISRLSACVHAIGERIVKKEGECNVTMAPTLFGQKSIFGEELESDGGESDEE
jgi:translation initiation factor 2 subunit 1